MQITITLKDPRYCDGCPLLAKLPKCKYRCKIFDKLLDSVGTGYKYCRIRPKECIERYGE